MPSLTIPGGRSSNHVCRGAEAHLHRPVFCEGAHESVPPGAAVSSVGEGGAAAEGKDKAKEGGQVKTEGVAGTTAGAGDGSAAAGAEEAEPEPVGR